LVALSKLNDDDEQVKNIQRRLKDVEQKLSQIMNELNPKDYGDKALL